LRVTGQQMPAEVILTDEMNAWIAPLGGVLGIGSKWILALGLPFVQSLTISELEAVIAHEFGQSCDREDICTSPRPPAQIVPRSATLASTTAKTLGSLPCDHTKERWGFSQEYSQARINKIPSVCASADGRRGADL
jgi:hypothetical protein